MSRLAEIRAAARPSDMLRGQLAHLAIAVLMALGAETLLGPGTGGTLLGLGSPAWARAAIWLAVAHQVLVALVFRFQLYTGFMTRLFGDRALALWGAVFFPLLLARPILLLLAGLAGDTPISGYRPAEIVLGLGLLAVAAYTMYSVARYFTFARALGGDHFRDDIIALPLVREGAFRLTEDAMYRLGFLGLWGLALICGSWNALVVALFQHAYVWVHMYLIEAPDMRAIYR